MTKTLLVLSLVCLGILAIGTTLFAQSPAFWLATGSSTDQYIRAALMLVLAVQLITEPPRHVLFRILSGLLSIAVGVWSLEATYANHMPFLDTMSFMIAAIAIGITALERQTDAAGTASGSTNRAITA
jgi:hypothetical protein